MAKKIEILENTLLKLLVRRGTDTDRRTISLSEGELGYTTDTERLFIGNGEPGGVVAGNKFLGCDSDPAATFTTALTGDLAFDTNTKSLCAFKGSGAWERVSSLTESTGDIDVLVDAGDILTNACGRNMQINSAGRIQTKATSLFTKIDTINTDFLSIPRKLNLFDDTSSQTFTFPTNALGGKYLRTDASGNLTWEDPVGAAEFFYNSENGPIPVGAVIPFTAGGVIPTGYLVCNGQEVSRTTYSDLFDVIGVNYGSTTGSTFKVPDYSLSTLYGVDSDPHNAQVYKVGADVNLGNSASDIINIYGGGGGTTGAFGTTNSIPAGTYLVDVNWIENVASGTDEDTSRTVSQKFNIPTGNYLHFANSGTEGFYAITTSQTAPIQSSSDWINVNTLAGFIGGALANDATSIINGFAIKLDSGSSSTTTYTGSEYVAIDVGDIDGTTADPVLKNNTSDDWFVTTGSNLSYNRAMYIRNSDTDPWLNIHPADDGDRGPFVAILQPGASIGHSGGYTAKYWVLKGTATTTPSTQSPLSAQGTIYVIKAIPDTVANPTLTVVAPLTATVDGVNKTNTAFSPLVGDIVIGQPDAAEAVPPGVEAFDTAGTSTFTTKTRYTKFHVTGSGSTGGDYTGSNAATLIGYLNLPIGTVLDLQIGAGIPSSSTLTDGNYSQISHNGTVLVKSDGAIGGVDYNAVNAVNTGTLNKTYTVGGNQVVEQNSFIIEGGAGVYTRVGDDRESVGPASFWGSWPAPGAGALGNRSGTIYTSDGMAMFEWADTAVVGSDVTGGGGADKEFVGLTGTSGTTAITQTAVGTYTYQVDDLQGVDVNTSKIRGLYIRCKGRNADGDAILRATLPDNITTPRPFFQTGEINNIDGHDFIELIRFLPINKNQQSFQLDIISSGVEYEIIGAEQITSGSGGLKDPNHTVDTFDVTTSFQDLDLSSIVGSNKAQVTMEVYDGDTGCNLFFRRKGSVTDPYVIENNAGWGASSVTTGPSNDGGIVTVVTDSSGVTEYRSDFTSTGVKYKVLTYQVIS